jgi:long-chain fatty acid transport protein
MRILASRPLAVALTLCVLAPSVAQAGGMFLPARGARPLGRAGSFVAGADDLEALYYNPAGLAGAAYDPTGETVGRGSAMVDLGFIFQNVHYDRVDSGGNQLPGVDNNNHVLPIPFLAVAWRPEALGRRVTFSLGAFAPYTAVPEYSPTGPQRYSLVSLNGTVAAIAELAVSVRLTPQLYLGGGFQNMFITLNNTVALSGCTQLNCSPEDPGFDALTQTKVTSNFTPSANFGALYVLPKVRIGLSAQLPFFVHAAGTIATRLPSDPQFDGAMVVGNKVTVDLNLPAVLRAGIEVRPTKQVRVEVGFDYETWQLQDKLSFVPDGIYIDHVVGIGRYDLRPMSIDRSMTGVYSIHVGGEWDVLPHRLTLRAGYMFESSSTPDETLTVLTPDGDKHLLTLGVGVKIGKIRLDAGYGHFFQADRVITDSRSLQLNPIEPSLAVAVGNGTYMVSTDVLSIGIEGRF